MKFYPGLHQLKDAQHFERCFLSINRLRRRKGPFKVKRWIMDSGAFTEISTHGEYRHSVKEYAKEARCWEGLGKLELIVSQDYMCEAFILQKTGMTVRRHQRLTIDRYRALLDCDLKTPIMPVLQGYTPDEYRKHLDMYGDLLTRGMRVGVGSVCKRNSKPEQVIEILSGLKADAPELRFHGFGLKYTALSDRRTHRLLYSSDSMAWSFAARYEGRDQNDWREAQAYVEKVEKVMSR
jgi:hypothetical protein